MKPAPLQAQKLVATIDPSKAGRVATLSYDGQQLLVGPEVNPDNWGSTYWTSPQSDWSWPPIPEIDHVPFEVVSESPLRLSGPVALLGQGQLRLHKTFRPLPELEALELEYELENVGATALQVAGWEISRVAPGGLTFFPTGQQALSPIEPHGLLEVAQALGHSFYDHQSFELGRSTKLHADGEQGYLAHVTAPQAGKRLLFLKLFTDSPAAAQAPGEGEVEIFANEDGRYVEIEVQGPLQLIAAGQRQSFSVRWAVRPVPAQIDVRVGSRELIEFTQGLARELR